METGDARAIGGYTSSCPDIQRKTDISGRQQVSMMPYRYATSTTKPTRLEKPMGDKTKIEWTDATWNPVVGCSKVSEGCKNCYAESVAARFAIQHKEDEFEGYYYDVLHYTDTEQWVWSGETVRKQPQFNPLTARKPRTIFVCSMGDLFHESVPDEWIDDVMAVIAMTPQHRYMILTKRPERMAKYFDAGSDRYRRAIKIMTALDMWQDEFVDSPEYDFALEDKAGRAAFRISLDEGWPLPNLALGVSIENQYTADYRIPFLLQTPAKKRFVSYEPALGSVTLEEEWLGICSECGGTREKCKSARIACCPDCRHGKIRVLDLVIMGGESGPNARPMHPDWARSMRDQCEIAGVPFHFKQWGKWVYPTQMTEETFRAWDYLHGTENHPPKPWGFTKQQAGRLLDGVEHNGSINWEKKS
jgi:protein gp37